MNKTLNEKLIGVTTNSTYDLTRRDERIAFAQDKWGEYITSYANRFKNAVSGYEDFVQEAALIIIKAADAWDPNKSEAKYESYVYSSLRNSLMDLSTRTRQGVAIPSGSIKLDQAKSVKTCKIKDDLCRQDNNFNQIDILDLIHSCNDSKILLMYYQDGMTIQEIADELRESRSSIHRKLSNSTKIVGKKLK